jgi:fermentation-respiration switch protein FrsA (DUF1100 family)
VHLWGSSLDPENVSYRSSTIAAIDGWGSPVLLIHGGDDRNVQLSQTTGPAAARSKALEGDRLISGWSGCGRES